MTVRGPGFDRINQQLKLGTSLQDGVATFAVELGDSWQGGAAVSVVVAGVDAAGKVKGWAKGSFSARGDACNFFELALAAEGLTAQNLDGDGETGAKDCDDTDPCRSTLLEEASDLCGSALPVLPAACLAKLKAEGKTAAVPYCGDGVDQDCDGKDAACITDLDCDGYSPPTDCDDKDKAINPSAKELCDGKDNNCNKVTDEGCGQCDVDGDGFAAIPGSGTTPATCKAPATDPDDYDAGIHPSTTTDTSGAEGGTAKTALREFCSYSETKNSTAAAKVRHRDLDHDGDKLIAIADGCPSESCDADGDGFSGTACSPVAAKLDCNDTNPTIFPGAPDKCGDGIAQNCVADIACASVTDGDGDGYASADDCNDKDSNVHPWATDTCDGKDNDCDGLTDEGNPDPSGASMPTNVKKCTDDDDGQCAAACTAGTANCSSAGRLLSGVCACSAVTPNGIRDKAGKRTACAKEDLTIAASPRCFAATQPQVERCTTGDWDCDGKPFVKGQAFQTLGKSCGVTKGNCKEGKVTGCDLSSPVENFTLAKKVDPDFHRYWICSGTLPVPEKCDGKDDDCDGVLPATEQDTDKDGYIGCTTCTLGSGTYDLASTLKGCKDCSTSESDVYPGAKEACNGKDDNCANGITDDGKDVCPAQSKTCCSLQKACVDLKTDAKNCGACAKACASPAADCCEGGKCVCGKGGSLCGAGQVCKGGKCVTAGCGAAGVCTGCCIKAAGCCAGTTDCKASSVQTATQCGKAGAVCKTCDDLNECTTDKCSSGVCSSTKADMKLCGLSAGRCWDSKCCKGCISAGKCVSGSANNLCGQMAAACVDCVGSDPCKTGTCKNNACVTTNLPSNTSCSSNTGRCLAGTCCTGCISGSQCRTGIQDTLCGSKGDACFSCATSLPCRKGKCKNASCTTVAQTAGTACINSGKSGKCAAGACCLGCLTSSGGCFTGTMNSMCGSGGSACTTCTSSSPCKGASCATGVCTLTNKSAGVPCVSGGKSGKCVVGYCCLGCMTVPVARPDYIMPNVGKTGTLASSAPPPPNARRPSAARASAR